MNAVIRLTIKSQLLPPRGPLDLRALPGLHVLVGAHAEEGEPVAVGIEVDRGLVVTALLAAVRFMRSTRAGD
jgi:hypothetical protein